MRRAWAQESLIAPGTESVLRLVNLIVYIRFPPSIPFRSGMNLNATRQKMAGKATGAAEAIEGLRKVVDAHSTPTSGTSQVEDIKPTVGGRKPTKSGADGDNESIAAFPQRVGVSVMIFLALDDDARRCAVNVERTTAVLPVEKLPICTVT